LAPYTDFTMLRYSITSRALYPGDEQTKQAALLEQATRWIAEGVEFLQLREKDLSAATLASLARNLLKNIDLASSPTRLLINFRADVALATGAHGVHLTSGPGELTPAQVRFIYAESGHSAPLITVSCHTLADIRHARQDEVDAILFGPVFEKPLGGVEALPGQGLGALLAACTAASPTPVYALGGVTLQNASTCLDAGAAGIAGIRVFQAL
jgi:thiamine-phosphate pyrophosphorylase